MLKKQRLTAMEGKHHDAKPRYSRKGRVQPIPKDIDMTIPKASTGEWHDHNGELLYVTGGGRVSAIVKAIDSGYLWGWINPLFGLGSFTFRGLTPTLEKAKRSVESIHDRRNRYLRTGNAN